MKKRAGMKLVSLIAAVSVILSVLIPLNGIIASAQTPSLPKNAVIVLDEDGLSQTVGDYYNYLWDRLRKATAAKDFSNISYVEFDVNFSDYDALKNAVASKGYTLCFNLTSSGGQWNDRSFTGSIYDYETGAAGGWHHYRIPKSAFTGNIDWSNVNYWMFGFNGSSFVTTGTLTSVNIDVKNICATSEPKPDLPEGTVAVLDEYGSKAEIGQGYTYLWDRLYKAVPSADLSSADFIEFDMKADMYDALKTAGKQKMFTVALASRFASTNNKWINRHFALNVFDYETEVQDDWHHFRIPKASFSVENGADWADKDFWMFGFWEGSGNTGELANAYIDIKNLCGTVDKPDMPKNVVAVIDETGTQSIIGNQYAELYDRVYKKIAPVDISAADYIEFDIKYDDYPALTSAADALGIYITFNVSSNDNKWYNRMRTNDINMYASAGKNKWYHFKVPIKDFVYVNMGQIDWTAVSSWYIGFDGVNIRQDTGDYKNFVLNVKNVCATAAAENDIFRPELDSEVIYTIDRLGISGTLGETAESRYSDISDTFTSTNIISGNITASKKIVMDVYVDNIKALPKNLSIAFGVGEGESYRYLNSIDISDKLTVNGWNRISLAVKDIKSDNPEELKNIACWRLSADDTSFVGENADCRLWVCNMAGLLDASSADMPENASVIIDEAGKEALLGDQYVYIFDRLWKTVEPVDLSNVYYIEFDADFGDFIEFSKLLNEKNIKITLNLTSSGKQWENRFAALSIAQYAIEGSNGWWHFKIPKSVFTDTNTGNLNWKAVNVWMMGLEGESIRDDTGDYRNLRIKIMNLCGTPKTENEIFRPVLSGDAVSVIDHYGVLGTFGESSYDKISDTFISNGIMNGDITAGKYISMQVYVDSIRALPENLAVSFGVSDGDSLRFLNNIEIARQIVKDGWNEVIISVTDIKAENGNDLKNIAAYRLSSEDTSAVGKYANSRLWICNVINIVDSTAPDMPENIIATLNYRGIISKPGYAFSWLADRVFAEAIGPFDISAADYMEFDFYVEDCKAFKKSMTANKMDIVFAISSGDPEKYSQSRYFNRSMANFADQIRTDGWNHIKIPIGKMISSGEGGNINLSAVTSFMLSFFGDNIQGDSSAIADNVVKIINVCATTQLPYIYIAPDKNKPSAPDKNAVYINTAEALFDENGTWNPIAVTVDTKYKTEGRASISNIFFDQTIRSNQLRYIFNETADMSDIKTFKFDIFISNIELLSSRAAMSAVLSTDIRGAKDFYKWKLDLSKLKNGWNSITIDTSEGYIKDGSPNFGRIKSIIVQCDSASFKSDEYVEKVTVNLDNIRYISKTGNKTLRINSDSDDFNDPYGDSDDYGDTGISADDVIENKPAEASVITDTKIVKKTVNNIVTQYSLMIIILAAEAVVIAAAITAVYFIKRKKTKKK